MRITRFGKKQQTTRITVFGKKKKTTSITVFGKNQKTTTRPKESPVIVNARIIRRWWIPMDFVRNDGAADTTLTERLVRANGRIRRVSSVPFVVNERTARAVAIEWKMSSARAYNGKNAIPIASNGSPHKSAIPIRLGMPRRRPDLSWLDYSSLDCAKRAIPPVAVVLPAVLVEVEVVEVAAEHGRTWM